MAVTNTISRTSSVKTSKKQTVPHVASNPEIKIQQPSIESNDNSTLSSLMLTAEILSTASTNPNKTSQIKPEIPSTSFFGNIKNSTYFPTMVISLTCAFLISASFYWAAKTMMKIKFEDMFNEKLPRYKNLVYSIGTLQNLDVDRVLLRDDLNDQFFAVDEKNSSIIIDVQKIFEQYKQETKEILIKHNTKNTINQFQDEENKETLSRVQAKQKSSV